MAIHIHPADIPSKYYKPLGQLVAGWSLTEALVSLAMCHIHGISDPKAVRLFTHSMNAVERVKAFKVS